MVQGTQSVRADDESETRPTVGEEGSTLRLTTTERRLKPRTSPESQPRIGFTGASKKFCPSSFFELVGAKPIGDGDAGERVLEGHDLGPSCGCLPQRRELGVFFPMGEVR